MLKQIFCMTAFMLLINGAFKSILAVPIYIENHSFEATTLLPGTWTNNSLEGWVGTGTGWGAFGAYNPPSADFPSGIADGNNVGYIERGGISQTLQDVLSPTMIYTLTVFVGSGLTIDPMEGYSIQFGAGSTVLAEVNTPILERGFFVPVTLSYTSLIDDPYLGQNLFINLIENGNIYEGSEANFDNVQLDASQVSSVPEPNTLLLITFGLFGTVFFNKKKLQHFI